MERGREGERSVMLWNLIINVFFNRKVLFITIYIYKDIYIYIYTSVYQCTYNNIYVKQFNSTTIQP